MEQKILIAFHDSANLSRCMYKIGHGMTLETQEVLGDHCMRTSEKVYPLKFTNTQDVLDKSGSMQFIPLTGFLNSTAAGML